MSTFIHLADPDRPHRAGVQMLCGIAVDSLPTGDDYTDAVIEVAEDRELQAGLCPVCWSKGKAWYEAYRRQTGRAGGRDGWRAEMAREEGMLGGVASYNDWMGY